MTTNMWRAARHRRAGLCIALMLIAGAAFADGNTVMATAAATASAASVPLLQGAEEYEIGALDLLELSVFQVPEMSRTVRVNSRGQISLPLVGSIQAGGLTAQQLEDAIAKKLGEGYLQDPQVSVFIKEYISQRVTIEGSVQKAGIYPLTGRTTLLQAIAMASGVDPLANESQVKVFRDKKGTGRETFIYDLDAIRGGKAPDPDIKGNDLVVVEKSATRSAVKTVADTVRGILSFGRF